MLQLRTDLLFYEVWQVDAPTKKNPDRKLYRICPKDADMLSYDPFPSAVKALETARTWDLQELQIEWRTRLHDYAWPDQQAYLVGNYISEQYQGPYGKIALNRTVARLLRWYKKTDGVAEAWGETVAWVLLEELGVSYLSYAVKQEQEV